MSSLGTVLLLNIFPALLPPINEEDRDFYDVLGLSSQKSSEQEIRKAYKLKSLSLHPDKVAQRRESAITAEEAAKEYQLVQEAHSCLTDKAARQKYHAVKCSPTRYRFLAQGGGLSNQMALLHNLSKASFADKTKLVLFVSIFPALVLIQPILIAVKVNHLLKQEGALEDASWLALLIPWWIFHGLFVAFWFMVSFLAPPEARMPILSTALEQLLWLLALFLLALRWDQTITADYAVVFIPVYLALVLKWLHVVMVMQQISKDLAKMVSKDHFLKVVLRGREPEELEEEELKDLHDKYVVVSQIPPDVEHDLEHDEDDKKLSDEEKEEIRVASSREFEAAMEAYGGARRSVLKSMLLDVTFLILVILKVDNHADMSWWVVFCPILISYGLRILANCFVCCCTMSPMDPEEVAVLAMTTEDLEAAAENKESGEAEKKESGQESGTSGKPPTDGSFPLFTEVILHGLNAEDFNGKTGIVNGTLKDGRQEVYIEELDKKVALKITNMKNKNVTEPEPAPVPTSPEATANEESKAEEPSGDSSTGESPQQQETKEPSKSKAPKDESQPTTDTAGNDPAAATADEKKGTDENGSDVEASIHIDEETYRAYQSAYAAAEANAVEKRLKASQNNCAAIFALTMICLLIAKLQQAYDAEAERDENGDDADVDVGFNTLWLLFPLFLIAGFMISCCACLIYSAPDPDELMKKDGEGGGDAEAGGDGNANQGGEGGADTPIVFAPPPPPPASADETPAATAEVTGTNGDNSAKVKEEAKEETEDNVAPPGVEGDINDLD